MRKLVLMFFLCLGFVVQGFGNGHEMFMAVQKAKKCSSILTNHTHDDNTKLNEYNKCFNDLSKECFEYDSCSDCLAYIIMSIDLIPTYSSKIEKHI